jgi:archaemetzincin
MVSCPAMVTMRYAARLHAAAICLWTCSIMAFEPPGPEARHEAIGPTELLPATLRRALTSDADFLPIPKPGPHDWLAVHPEPGQTFAKFWKAQPNRPDAKRDRIYLVPLGEFVAERSPSIETLREFAAAYFQMEVRMLAPVTFERLASRTNRMTKRRQILTRDILSLFKTRLPSDAFCLLSITMEDLYPEPSWNFVFGEAAPRERVGVYSFARYDPAFFRQPRDANYRALLLRRSAKVLAHETAHMFGLRHCIYFHCVMNGSNHLEESDARPMHLCPVCLRKLQFSIGFDVASRYRALAECYRKMGIADESEWTSRRLKKLEAAASQ